METRQRLKGLLTRRERWGLSWRGWLVFLVIAGGAALAAVLAVHPFLAVTHREETKILVVEGWVKLFAIDAAVAEYKSGGYERVFTTGGPVSGLGHFVNDYQTSASIGAGQLRRQGLGSNEVQMAPSRVMGRDRTYNSAIALKNWFVENHLEPKAINVLTEGAHARRTRLLFEKAFGDKVRVGIISVPSPDYDAEHWWHYSEGVREVIGEGIAYVYARFFFHPAATEGG